MSNVLTVLNTPAAHDAYISVKGEGPIPEGSKILLLLPPFYTPYTPPLGISVLKSYIERLGYQVKCLDLNIIPEIWVAHHKYFEILQGAKGMTPQHGYTNLWYILQAHMLAHLNGLDLQGCIQLLKKILPVYDLEPTPEIINGLGPVVTQLFRDIEQVLRRELDLSNYAVVGTSTYSTSLAPSLHILKSVKELYPNVMTIMGGGVFADDLATGSDNLESLLRGYDFVDHIVMGEGEILFREILQGRLRHKRLLSREALPESSLNMKEVTIPDYSDFHIPNYLHLCIEGARSCPFQCTFCSETVQWGTYRKKPSNLLAEQMIHLAEKHDNRTFFMGDSLMNPYIEDLSKSLLESKVDILYDGYLRADRIATDRVKTKRWAQSGCVRTRLGIESASAKVLEAMHKETTPAGISKAIKTLASAGIRVTTLWIVGFPGETEEDFQETLDFIREHHRFIYELDVHYYYYYPYGQVWSRLHKSYPLYSPEVIEYVKFQQWEIEDCYPPRPVKFERLRRINDLATELGIPNLHTLDARYRAEERWQLLSPLAAEFFEGTLVSRDPNAPAEGPLSRPRTTEAPITGDPGAALSYVVRISKQIDVEILRRSARTLINYNEILQLGEYEQGLSSEPLPPDLEERVVLEIEAPSAHTPSDLAEIAREMSRGIHPRAGDSIRIAVGNDLDSSLIILAAHRAVADARSVTLLLEDLFRIYEQLANDKPVTLRRPEISYGEYLQRAASFEIAPSALGDSPAEPRRSQPSSRRAVAITIDSDLVRRFTPKLQQQSQLTFIEFILGGIALSLAEAGPRGPLELEIRADTRLVRPELQYAAGPLHATGRITLDWPREASALEVARKAGKRLRQTLGRSERDRAADVVLNLEHLTAEPWMGGDEWAPQGPVYESVAASGASIELIGYLDQGRVSLAVNYAEEMAAEVEHWLPALRDQTPSMWDRLLAEIEGQASQFRLAAAAGRTPQGARFQPRERRSVSAQEMVEFSGSRGSIRPFPLVGRSRMPELDPVGWATANRKRIEELLLEHGAILFRGLDLATPERFRQFAAALVDELLEFNERAAPRVEVAPRVYTSTEYPPEYLIPLHHENAFAHKWPMKLLLYCQTPALRGGETPIADDRRFFALLNPEIRERFREKQVMYVRNYSAGVDLRWQEVFQTEDRAVVEEYCRTGGLQYEWLEGDRLRTIRIAPAIVKHPRTGLDVWFNHAHLFHLSNLETSLHESFAKEFREEDLPRNTYYGDGAPIESAVLDEIRETYRKAAVRFPWQRQDVLLVDNMTVAHGREPFVGERKTLVIMADWSSAYMLGGSDQAGILS